jgi:hypothetical protein
MTNTVPHYEDFSEIKKKIWLMLDDAVTNRSSPFRIPVFVCGDQSDFDGRIVVLRIAIAGDAYHERKVRAPSEKVPGNTWRVRTHG